MKAIAFLLICAAALIALTMVNNQYRGGVTVIYKKLGPIIKKSDRLIVQ